MSMKKVKRTTLRNKADALFSRLVRGRDRVCQRCGAGEGLQCAHIWSRRYVSTRWNEDNALALCRGCHAFFTMRPAHWNAWIEDRLGVDGYRELRERAISISGPVDYPALLARLEKRLEAVAALPLGVPVEEDETGRKVRVSTVSPDEDWGPG